MPVRITGLPAVVSGATVGVEASSPPNITQHRRDPTQTDYYNFNTGDLWLNSQTNVQTPANSIYRLWVLMAKANFVATWVLIINGSGGPIVALQPAINGAANGAVVTPTLGVIQINNTDANIVPVAGVPNPNNLNLDLANNVYVTNNAIVGLTAPTNQLNPSVLNNGNLNVYSGTTGIVQILNFAPGSTMTSAGVFQMLKSHGTPFAPTAITSGDAIGTMSFGGFDGTSYVSGAAISSTSSGAIAPNQVGANLVLSTHPISTSGLLAATPRITINPDGSIFNSGQDAASASAALRLNNNSGGTGVTLNLQSTYNTAVGATQQMMVIDNTGNVGTNGAIAPGFQYATGVFTPSLSVGGATAGIVYTDQTGSYTRIGNAVLYALTLAVSSFGGNTGSLNIEGLPFTVSNIPVLSQSGPMAITGNFTMPAGNFYLFSAALPTTTSMRCQAAGTGAGVVLQDTDFALGNASMTVTGHYYV